MLTVVFMSKAWLEDSIVSCIDVYILQSFCSECLLLIYTEIKREKQIFIIHQSLLEKKKSFLCFNFFSFIVKLSLLWKFQLKALHKTRQKLKQKVSSMSKSWNLKGLKTFRKGYPFRSAKANRAAHTETMLVPGCYPFKVAG